MAKTFLKREMLVLITAVIPQQLTFAVFKALPSILVRRLRSVTKGCTGTD